MPSSDKPVPTSSTDTLTPSKPSSPKATKADSTAKAPLPPTTKEAPSSNPEPVSERNGDVEEEEEKERAPAQDEIINMSIFNQILELDEEDNQDFSREMVEEYYTQAAQTFKDMDAALVKKDLSKLSDLGHFFKGSSATLGVTHVQKSCEKIQRYGQLRDEEKGIDLEEKQALDLISQLIIQVKGEYLVAERWMKDRYPKLDDE
ncbi:signal transduction histidine kinase [Rhodocollybia butyracea]|uniref:Signal transduction histidine kinase n=1 Tax=Rhodocollybia butyracea TaxID=206335 RepID=A0A9P5P9K6_9AGAR|nr:signal transduction histidine kinase [Rhodocollybia butyracea]KAF9071257.1 signal transduction histidine kinase [Rhodocollybia butyracea]